MDFAVDRTNAAPKTWNARTRMYRLRLIPASRPFQTILQNALVGRMLMRLAVVAESDADDATLGMLRYPHDRIRFAGAHFVSSREHLDGSALVIWLVSI